MSTFKNHTLTPRPEPNSRQLRFNCTRKYFRHLRNSSATAFPKHAKLFPVFADLVTNEVCIDYSLLVGLIITWILIQMITLISCIMLVRRYKKYYEQEVIRNSSDELHRNFGFGVSNLDNRRVHWADNGSEFT